MNNIIKILFALLVVLLIIFLIIKLNSKKSTTTKVPTQNNIRNELFNDIQNNISKKINSTSFNSLLTDNYNFITNCLLNKILDLYNNNLNQIQIDLKTKGINYFLNTFKECLYENQIEIILYLIKNNKTTSINKIVDYVKNISKPKITLIKCDDDNNCVFDDDSMTIIKKFTESIPILPAYQPPEFYTKVKDVSNNFYLNTEMSHDITEGTPISDISADNLLSYPSDKKINWTVSNDKCFTNGTYSYFKDDDMFNQKTTKYRCYYTFEYSFIQSVSINNLICILKNNQTDNQTVQIISYVVNKDIGKFINIFPLQTIVSNNIPFDELIIDKTDKIYILLKVTSDVSNFEIDNLYFTYSNSPISCDVHTGEICIKGKCITQMS